MADPKDPSPPYAAKSDQYHDVERFGEVGADPQSLALMPAGLEVVPPSEPRRSSGQSGKEVSNVQQAANVHPEIDPRLMQYDPPPRFSRRRVTRRRVLGMKCGLFCALVLLLVLAIALGIGLGVGLTAYRSEPVSSTPSTSSNATNSTDSAAGTRIGGSLDASYYSTSGAWNGTALAIAQQGSSESTSTEPVLYFQHYSGDVRWTQLTSNGSWIGGSALETVANDAKNNTPIAAVTWTADGTSTTHVFYVDSGNTIKEFTKTNGSDEWRDGSIGSSALHPNDVDLVTMQACLADIDAPAIRLWYASNSSTYDEYLWRLSDDQWEYQYQWQRYSGTAGISCHIEPGSTNTHVAFVNTDNDVEIWYKKISDSSAKWSKTNVNITSVSPTTSLAYTDLFYVQTADSDHIHAYNITWQGDQEGSSPGHDDVYSVEGKHRVADSRFAATTATGSDGEETIFFFDQVSGDDIMQYKRSMDGGDAEWTNALIEIPDS